jgi:hypothetical protein
MTRPARLHMSLLVTCVLGVAALALDPALAQYKGQKNGPDANWPCVQRRNPEISAAAIWSGPEIGEDVAKWWNEADVASAVRAIASRRTSMDEAEKLVDKVAGSPGDKQKRLTALFVGTLETINTERNRIIRGLERYALKQRALADRIEQDGDAIAKLRADKPVEGLTRDKLPDLEQQMTWDTRIFDERNQSLSYVCESQVPLEARAFNLARIIQERL